ncbi:unnamed protein product [Ascophyllum nodosum]
MAPPAWILSIPIGFGSTFSLRFVSLLLQIKSGVPMKNAQGRDQPLSKEVAMKDTDGYARRAFLAHCNSWEAMILWTSSVAVAKIMDVEESTMNSAAMVWMGARFVYAPAYIFIKNDKASYFRSAMFMVGTVSAFSLMVAAVKKA